MSKAVKKKVEGGAGGIKQPVWIWASMVGGQKPNVTTTQPVPQTPAQDKTEDKISDQTIDPIQDLLNKHGNVTAPVFMNLLKAEGFTIVPPVSAKDLSMKVSGVEDEKKDPTQETNSATSNVQVLRGKDPKRESVRVTGTYSTFKFLESSNRDNGVGVTRFKVCLIEEGLGNFKDRFFYTRKALESAVSLFEGKKFFIDHPDALEEKTRPERSVRDVGGYYENCRIEEGDKGQAALVADLVIFPDEPFRWIRALLREAADYQVGHPDKSLIGLSINASGSSEPMQLSEFLKSSDIPQSAIPKLNQAIEAGVDEVKVVYAFKEAVSCDLVTEAGAGGKILEMLERDKIMDDKKKIESEEKKEAAPEAPAKHDDAAQDKELIAQMLKKHLGDDASEEDMAAAHEAYEYMSKEAKMESEEAAKSAGDAIKCAKHMMAKKEAAKTETDDKDADDKKEAKADEKEEKKESDDSKKESALRAENIRLKGEVASFKETERKRGVEAHLESKLAASGLPRAVTKTFRESVKAPKTKEEVDALFAVFMEGFKATRSESGSGIGFHMPAEKIVETKSRPAGLASCLRD